MDSPLSPSPQVQIAKTLQHLQDCINELKTEFEDSAIPVNDDNTTLHRFSAKLEFLLQAGLKARSSLLGGKKDYWNYFCDSLSNVKGLSDGIRFVKTITELKTALGRGRALIRFSLVHQRLADTIQHCVSNRNITTDWYHPHALWHQSQHTSVLVSALYDLNGIQFDLSPRGYDLDTAWPTFARKTFGSLLQSWAPPSRSVSVSSLVSVPNQESLHNTSVSSFVEDNTMEQLENEKTQLQQQMELLKKERDVAVQELDDMNAHVEQLQDSCSDYQTRFEELTGQIKNKENTFKEKEARLQKQVDDATKLISEIGRQGDPFQGGNFDLTELRVRLLARDKMIMAHQLEIKALTLDLDSKNKVTEKKSRLIELLDRKLDDLELANKKLTFLWEESKKMAPAAEAAAAEAAAAAAAAAPVADTPAPVPAADVPAADVPAPVPAADAPAPAPEGATQTDGEMVSPDFMKDVIAKMTISDKALTSLEEQLKGSEKLNAGLMVANNELRTMLHSMEDKGMKIANLAKEKLRMYSAENKQLKASVEGLSQAGGGTSPDQLEVIKGELEAKLLSVESREKQHLARQEELQERLKQMEEESKRLQLEATKSSGAQLEPSSPV